MILKQLTIGKLLCKCDFCGNEVVKQRSMLTNKQFQFCNHKCSSAAKKNENVIGQQVRENSLKNYGVEHHLMLSSVIEKREKTNIELYGCKNQFERAETIEYIANIVKNRTSEEVSLIREKSKKTCLEHYGVEHPSQHPIIHEKMRNKSATKHYTGNIDTQWGKFWHRSSWEKFFIEWCVSNSSNIENVEANIVIPYKFEDKKRIYFADFLITTHSKFLCEIKPESLITLPQNQAKCAAAIEWRSQNNTKFLHLNKERLFNSLNLLLLLLPSGQA